MQNYEFKSRKEYVKRVTSQEELKEIALYDEDLETKIWTVRNIDNQEFLKRIPLYDLDYRVKIEAIKKIEDQEVLKIIALWGEKTLNASLVALSRIENEETLIEVATISFDEEVAIEAIKRIDDQEFLKQRALWGKTLNEKLVALSRIKDKKILIRVTTESLDEEVVIEAMKKIPKRMIKEIKSKNWYVKAVCEDILSQ